MGKLVNNRCNGVSQQYFWYEKSTPIHSDAPDVFSIVHTNFTDHYQQEWNKIVGYSTGAVYIGIAVPNKAINIIFKKLIFKNNNTTNTIGGGCIHVNLDKGKARGTFINLWMTDTMAFNNSVIYMNAPTSLFLFSGVKYTRFNGSSTFENNSGSVIFALDSNVYLQGKMIFFNNTAVNGGAIRMKRNCQLYFMEWLNVSFVSNHAHLLGGAIYVHSDSYDKCGLQTSGSTTGNILFMNNSANTAGNSLFATPISKCTNGGKFNTKWKSHYYSYFNLPSIKDRGSLLQLSTTPFTFLIFHDRQGNLMKYPGEMFPLKFRVKDHYRRSVLALVTIEVYAKFDRDTKISLSQQGGNQIVEHRSSTSIYLQILIHSKMQANLEAFLVFSTPQILLFSKIIDITMLPCPLGFAHNNQTGSCECSSLFESIKGTECSIYEKTISRPTDIIIWVGKFGSNSSFAFAKDCPISYCNDDPKYTHFIIIDDEIALTNEKGHTAALCKNNRNGTLCGLCCNQIKSETHADPE